jgi:hypothetical protein
MGKNPVPGSWMNIPDCFSQIGLKLLKIFTAYLDLGSGIFLTLDQGKTYRICMSLSLGRQKS